MVNVTTFTEEIRLGLAIIGGLCESLGVMFFLMLGAILCVAFGIAVLLSK